ncbi:hypothetical protein AB7C87_01135 [Natrarchaeobius sp. A-rgal3]|uniref:hypothetical protein n=1 Tax=Natrarchaeobius versutus TaxID=1679078 RepID=UPI00350F68AD
MTARHNASGYLLLIVAVVVTGIVYLGVIPRQILAGESARAVRYLVVGWVPYVCTFYLIGRLRSSPGPLPSMRTADVGVALVLLSLLASLGLDAWGFTPEFVPAAHALQAVAIFVGLALLGWGLGRRSNALSEGT